MVAVVAGLPRVEDGISAESGQTFGGGGGGDGGGWGGAETVGAVVELALGTGTGGVGTENAEICGAEDVGKSAGLSGNACGNTIRSRGSRSRR